MIRPRYILPALCVLVSCSNRNATVAGAGEERQVTNAAGEARSAVLSRDGTSLAFAAVAGGYTNPQIWIVRTDGAAPPRPLTNDASQNYEPEFSPDGRTILFTSSREPKGIYRVPATGGTPQLMIQGGYSAKVSPDGNTLLYGTSGKVVQRPFAGGAGSLLLPAIENSFAPVWSPDGARVLVATTTPPSREQEWWIARPSGGEPLRTSLGADLRRQGFNYIAANAWLPDDWIVFTGRQGETQTLWKVRLAPDGRIVDQAVRATTDEQGDSAASFTAGRLVFARTRVDMNFWALPLDASGEHVTASPEPLTSSVIQKGQQSMAGSRLLYSAQQGDRFSLVLKEGKREKKLRDGFFALLAPDGSRYAYGEGTKDRLNLFLKSFSWWSFGSSRLCANCGMPRAFSRDGRKLLLWSDSPPTQHLDLLDLETRKLNPIVSSSEDLYAPHLSPDGAWVSFVVRSGDGHWRGFVAPLRDEKPVASSEWVPVTPVTGSVFHLLWSDRNDLMYVLSSRGRGGNLRYLDAQPLNGQTMKPVGEPRAVYEFDESLVPGMDPVWNPVSLDHRRIVLELGGIATNIWIR